MRTKKTKRKTKKRGRLFSLLFFLFLFLCLIYYLLALPIWQIKNVVVNGTQMLSAREIETMAAIPKSQNLFFTSLKRSRINLDKISAIKSYQIFRLPPATILINITERKPVVAIVFPGRSYFVDDQGYIVNFNQSLSYNISNLTDLPVVDGVNEKTLLSGVKLDDQTTKVVLQVVLDLSRLLSLSKIRLELNDYNEINLQLDDILKVKLGEADQLPLKMKIFKTLLAQIAGKWQQVEYLDVRYPNNPVIKLRSSP